MTDTTMTRRWRLVIPALVGAAMLALAGCESEDDMPATTEQAGTQAEQTDESEQQPAAEPETEEAPEPANEVEPQDTGLSAADIIAAVEPHGFDCAEEEPVLKSRSEKVVCRGPDYAFVTATKVADESDVENQLARAKEALCDSDFTDEDDALFTAVSGAWVFVPGGGDENNLALYDAAIADLGLERNTDPCSA